MGARGLPLVKSHVGTAHQTLPTMTQLVNRATLVALIVATPASAVIAQSGDRGGTSLSSPCVRMLGCYVNDAREWTTLLGQRANEGTIIVPITERSLTTLLPFENDGVDAIFAAVIMPQRGFDVVINSNRSRSAELELPRAGTAQSVSDVEHRRTRASSSGALESSLASGLAAVGRRSGNDRAAGGPSSSASREAAATGEPRATNAPRDFENPMALNDARSLAMGSNDDRRRNERRDLNRNPRGGNDDTRGNGNDDVAAEETVLGEGPFTKPDVGRGPEGLPVGTRTSPGNAVSSSGQGAGVLTGNATSTPEPASIALLATGLAGIGGAGWKRRRR